MRKLDEKNYRLKGCYKYEYATLEEFIVKNFSCRDCGCSLSIEKDNVFSRKCANCESRSQRIDKAETITVEVNPPEYSSYEKGGTGFTIYMNIENNTDAPIKLKLQECSIFANGRQRVSDYYYNGYAFSEEYVFPNTPKTLGKIWITDKWSNPKLIKGDFLTLSLKESNGSKTYYYKFLFTDYGTWDFNDYYELD